MPLLSNHTFKWWNLFYRMSEQELSQFDNAGYLELPIPERWVNVKPERSSIPEQGSLSIVGPEWADVFESEFVDDPEEGLHPFIDRLNATSLARFQLLGETYSLTKCAEGDFYSTLLAEHAADPHPQKRFEAEIYPFVYDPTKEPINGRGKISSPETRQLNGLFILPDCGSGDCCGKQYAIIDNYELILDIDGNEGASYIRTLPLCGNRFDLARESNEHLLWKDWPESPNYLIEGVTIAVYHAMDAWLSFKKKRRTTTEDGCFGALAAIDFKKHALPGMAARTAELLAKVSQLDSRFRALPSREYVKKWVWRASGSSEEYIAKELTPGQKAWQKDAAEYVAEGEKIINELETDCKGEIESTHSNTLS